jgi:hypothetical protein
LFWRIVPERALELLAGEDRARATHVMAAVRGMKKLDLAALEHARGNRLFFRAVARFGMFLIGTIALLSRSLRHGKAVGLAAIRGDT